MPKQPELPGTSDNASSDDPEDPEIAKPLRRPFPRAPPLNKHSNDRAHLPTGPPRYLLVHLMVPP